MKYAAEATYGPDGVDRALVGPFDTPEQAQAWMEDQPDDSDVYEQAVVAMNEPEGRVIVDLDAVAGVLVGLPGFSIEHFTCDEAETLAQVIRAQRGDEAADGFLRWHAENDDEGDRHHQEATA